MCITFRRLRFITATVSASTHRAVVSTPEVALLLPRRPLTPAHNHHPRARVTRMLVRRRSENPIRSLMEILNYIDGDRGRLVKR